MYGRVRTCLLMRQNDRIGGRCVIAQSFREILLTVRTALYMGHGQIYVHFTRIFVISTRESNTLLVIRLPSILQLSLQCSRLVLRGFSAQILSYI